MGSQGPAQLTPPVASGRARRLFRGLCGRNHLSRYGNGGPSLAGAGGRTDRACPGRIRHDPGQRAGAGADRRPRPLPGERRAAAGPARYVDAAYRRLRPGERIAALSLEQGSSPVIVTLDQIGDRAQRLLFLDPPTGRVLASAWRDGGVIGAARHLHDGLFLSGFGRWIIGLGGVGLMLASLTGLWAWLTRERPKKSTRRKRTDSGWAAAHRSIGLWSAIPVMASAATGLALVPVPGATTTPPQRRSPARPCPSIVWSPAPAVGHAARRARSNGRPSACQTGHSISRAASQASSRWPTTAPRRWPHPRIRHR